MMKNMDRRRVLRRPGLISARRIRTERGDRHRAMRPRAMGVGRPDLGHILRLGRELQLGPEQQRELPVAARQRQRLSAHDRLHASPRLLSTGVTFAVPVTGGPAAPARSRRTSAQRRIPQAWAQQLEIWVSPWGFLKGAQQNNATARRRTVDGEQLTRS